MNETFGKRKAERILKKVKFIYTPKHDGWLNMAGIEINIMHVMDRNVLTEEQKVKKGLASDVMNWSKQGIVKKCDIE